ncbi:MAG TPA: cytochrome C oxidase subunit IV family protein [Bacteroidales bacterium]|nr:cytochrome C oxidase subunit IV family protein [Bacteroidales bacterium]
MISEVKHITGYPLYGKVLVGLLVLTTFTILVPWLDLTAFTALIALVLASTKAGIVMTYFMHLKVEDILLKILVIMVLAIYVSVILLTLSDYIFR